MNSERFLIRAAVYLLLFKNNKILLSRRFNTGWKDGYYSLIAGHLDGGESVSQAMIREAKEEAGIVITKKNLLPATVIHRVYLGQEYIDFFFVAKKWSGKPTINEPDKCDEMKWFPLDKLPFKTLPYIKEAISNYKKKVCFFESGW
jgi:8-oxo-dGTP pyrophosphatase MutT (NUDIX family)